MPPPVTLPPACDLTPLGLSAGRIESLEIICQRSVNTIYRIRCAGRWHVLKWIEWPEKSVELLAYRLLQQENVPVLPHHAAGRALLLEDLAHSTTWRLAEECDMGREETGRSLAAWYRQLHAAGHRLLATDPAALAALGREVDAVTPAAVGALGTRFDLPAPLLRRAAAQIDPITQAIRRLPQTLTYNDFHGSNLALHRSDPAQAVVFDYHLLGVGLAHSDCRNVSGSLGQGARAAFLAAYGPTDEREQLLDAPVATLFALLQAAESPRLPTWADALLAEVRHGALARQLDAACAGL